MLSGREKATIFLSLLGTEAASRVLRYLPGELADIIATGINQLPSPSPEALNEVLNDYEGFLALPGESFESPRISPPPPKPVPRKSYSFLMYERPQTVAFLVSMLPEDEKDAALSAIPKDKELVRKLMGEIKQNSLTLAIKERLKEAYLGKLF